MPRVSHLPVPPAAASCVEESCALQQVNALIHPWQQVCIPYALRVELFVVDAETQFSVFLSGKHPRACLLQHSGLDKAFFKRSVSITALVLFCF